MLNSSLNGDSGKVLPRCSAFSHTCALLGQYVKEKKALGELSYEMVDDVHGRGSNDASGCRTMSLFPVNERTVNAPIFSNGRPSPLPHLAFNDPEPYSSEIISAPLTIFYAGQVIVFNDFPACKAKEIMDLANHAISQNRNPAPPVIGINEYDVMGDSADLLLEDDLPVARRASLHRFLEKRMDRIMAKSPYKKGKSGKTTSMSSPNGSNPWLGLSVGLP